MEVDNNLLSGVAGVNVQFEFRHVRAFHNILDRRLLHVQAAFLWSEFKDSCRLAAGAMTLHKQNKPAILRARLKAAHKLADDLLVTCRVRPFRADQRRKARALCKRLSQTIEQLPPAATSLGVVGDVGFLVADLGAALDVAGALNNAQLRDLATLRSQLNDALSGASSLPNKKPRLFYRDMLAAGIAKSMQKVGLKPQNTRDDVAYQWGDNSYARLLRLAIEVVEDTSPVEIFSHQANGLALLTGIQNTKKKEVACPRLLS